MANRIPTRIKRLRSLSIGLLTLFSALVLFFLLGEAVIRHFGGVRYGGWGDPSSIHLVQKQFVRNSRGLRGREIPYESAPNETRILCLGDSFTWGQMVEEEEAWPRVLEGKLSESQPDLNPVVINAGQLGWNTIDEYQWLAKEGMKYKPDAIVVGYFLNDAEMDHYSLDQLLPLSIERMLARSYFYFFLKYRIHMLKVRFGLTEGYEEYIRNLYEPDSLEWKKCKRALRLIRDLADSIDAGFLVVILPQITEWEDYAVQSVHNKVNDFCELREIVAVDALPAFQSSPLPWQELRIGSNDRHPSIAGHQIIAGVVAEGLLPLFVVGEQ